MSLWTAGVAYGNSSRDEDAMEALGEALEQHDAVVGPSHGSLLVTLTLEADGALAAALPPPSCSRRTACPRPA